jgi:ABC-type enterochelin transport system permease subunit
MKILRNVLQVILCFLIGYIIGHPDEIPITLGAIIVIITFAILIYLMYKDVWRK